RPPDHHPRAAAQRAAAADTGPAAATPRGNTTRWRTRSRAARQHARAALDRPTRAATNSRGARARMRDRNDHSQARPAAARPARRRTACSRTTGALVVAPRTDHLRGNLCTTRSADPRLLRADDPLPARPKRRPQTQPRTPHDPRHPQTLTPRDDRLHRTTHSRRQNTTQSNPLPQALPRPQALPATRTRTATGDLTDIEASLAQSIHLSRARVALAHHVPRRHKPHPR